ncbi:MAG: beta-ketoacyl-[acyl-carrier-protein] synthase family protein [Bacteroidota bacterium]
MEKRIVITGLGVVAPNALGIDAFTKALRNGKSGIKHHDVLQELKLGCQVAGWPDIPEEVLAGYFNPLQLKSIQASGIRYGMIAGIQAWKDAGLLDEDKTTIVETDWDSGCIFGSGLAGAKVMRDSAYLIDQGKSKRLGSTSVQQVMASGISAHLGGYLGLGNQVTTNASACSSGTESILMAYDRIQSGRAKRILCGGCDSSGPYVWAGFDAMRVMTRKSNDQAQKASRPLSATASGFVPGAGAGALVLESLESAQERSAPIYAEVLGGYVNSGGQRNGGTMTAPNKKGIIKCIEGAIHHTGIKPKDIDAISGHLTSTMFDPIEVLQWTIALKRSGSDFPYINAMKSLIGHCLSAAGAIESVGVVLQLKHQFLHPSINCEDIHPEIEKIISAESIPMEGQDQELGIIAKSSFGFGDVNSCVLFKKFD